MSEPDLPHVDVPGVEEMDVPEVPEPEEPDEGFMDPDDDYTEGRR